MGSQLAPGDDRRPAARPATGRRVELPSHGGVALAATWREPATAARGVAVIAPAMGVPARYYDAFAEHLADRGIASLAFDYRGFGASLQGPLKDVRATGLDWGGDAAAALEAGSGLAESLGVPLTWIGHSLGGQLLAFTDHARLDRVLLVSSGNGWWGTATWRMRWHAWLTWYAAWPFTWLWGYFPGRTIRLFTDLPSGPFRQISYWCTRRDFFLAQRPDLRARLAAVTAPTAIVSVTDDELLAESAFRWIEGLLSGTSPEWVRLDPATEGVRRLGHHGIFRRDRQAVWDRHLLPRIATT